MGHDLGTEVLESPPSLCPGQVSFSRCCWSDSTGDSAPDSTWTQRICINGNLSHRRKKVSGSLLSRSKPAAISSVPNPWVHPVTQMECALTEVCEHIHKDGVYTHRSVSTSTQVECAYIHRSVSTLTCDVVALLRLFFFFIPYNFEFLKTF